MEWWPGTGLLICILLKTRKLFCFQRRCARMKRATRGLGGTWGAHEFHTLMGLYCSFCPFRRDRLRLRIT